MRIYRIQNDNNEGGLIKKLPLKCPEIRRELEYDNSNIYKDGSKKRMHPDADTNTELQKSCYNGLIYNGSPYLFGCSSMSDLYMWFCPSTIGYLEANNMNIYIYDMPNEHIIHGTRQVAFNPKYATNKYKVSHKQLRHNSI